MTRLTLAPPPFYMDDPLSYEIRKRLSQDSNTFMAAVGQPRRGKSTSLLTTGCMVDAHHDFLADHVAFLPDDYLVKIERMKPGHFVLYDEPGAEWGARSFMSVANIMLSATTIIFGSRLINVGWAVPILKQSDVNMGRMLNYSYKMEKAPYSKGVATLYSHSVSEYTGKQYMYNLGMVRIAMPWQDQPEELVKYKKMKHDYQDVKFAEFYTKFAEKNKDKVEKTKLGPKEWVEIANQIVDAPKKVTMENKKGESVLDVDLIMVEMNISRSDATRVHKIVTKIWQDSGIGGQ